MNKITRKHSVFSYLQLGKFSVILPVSLTSFTGYFLYEPIIGMDVILVTIGVFSLGMAASVLNQVQESVTDSLMQRTQNRPIPSGKISRKHAIFFFIFTFFGGSLAVYSGGNPIALILGIFTLIWYNGVYTPLKKYTPFAIIPGSLTGAIPPVIGWTAAGGNPGDLTSVLLAFLFFMGQVPHFWLLIMKYGDQYRNAGFPSLTDIFSTRQINNLSFIWISASLISALMLASFGILRSDAIRVILVMVTITGIVMFLKLINNEQPVGRRKHFIKLNVYYFILIILLIADRVSA